MEDKEQGMRSARRSAEALLRKGALTREEHLEVFKRYAVSENARDREIAIELMGLFIEKYPEDFDRDITLEDLIFYGNAFSKVEWKEFGNTVLLNVVKSRKLPAWWIDRVADEESEGLRKAFALALLKLAKVKKPDLDRLLGMLEYFIDEPSLEVREILAEVFLAIHEADPERLHYFMNEFQKGAGSSRLALFRAVREKTKKESLSD